MRSEQKMTKCDKCQSRAIIYQKYSGMHLCPSHFEEDVRRKVREDLRKTGLFGRRARVAFGLSGRWSSAVLLHIMRDIFSRRKDIDFIAIIIDEGQGCASSLNQAKLLAERLEVPLAIASMNDPPRAVEASCCRDNTDSKMGRLLEVAREMEVGILATAHSLDDEAEAIFLKFLQGDVDGLFERQCQQGSLHWIKPLRRIPEKEIRLYALTHDLLPANCEDLSCEDYLHLQVKRHLDGFDSRHPPLNTLCCAAWSASFF
jgi:tRNA(Ile)-lysidine synthase TilS/MesJ